MSDEASKGIYDVVLMINHPNESLEVITNALGLQPDYKWQAGQPRSAPNGTPLPGVNRDTYWGFCERVAEHRYFFETAIKLLAKLEATSEFVSALLASGGRIRIVINLAGHTHIGDSLTSADLLRMGRLGIELNVGVFLEMT